MELDWVTEIFRCYPGLTPYVFYKILPKVIYRCD